MAEEPPRSGDAMDPRPEPHGTQDPLDRTLEPSDALFQNIIEKNVDGILVVRPDGTIRYANPAATRMLRRPLADLMGSAFGIPIVPGETTEIDLPCADGEIRVAEMRVAETEWEGKPALLASLRDISERKSLEAQLRQKVEELAEADRHKDEFLAMLVHELRNPLGPMRNALYMMKGREGDAGLVARMRGILDQEVRAVSRLVDDLLDVTRTRTGKLKLYPEPMDLSEAVQRAVTSTRALIEARGHRLRLELPAEPIRLAADPGRVEQILVNLLTNAAKYTDPGGSIEIAGSAEGEDVIVRVRDDGMGIAPEMLGRIFDLFAQSDNTLDRALGGLGIGLTLSRRLARLHGGELSAVSDGLGRGSVFVLRLPRTATSASAGSGDGATGITAQDLRTRSASEG
jgi:signal transduction histidine kinase